MSNDASIDYLTRAAYSLTAVWGEVQLARNLAEDCPDIQDDLIRTEYRIMSVKREIEKLSRLLCELVDESEFC